MRIRIRRWVRSQLMRRGPYVALARIVASSAPDGAVPAIADDQAVRNLAKRNAAAARLVGHVQRGGSFPQAVLDYCRDSRSGVPFGSRYALAHQLSQSAPTQGLGTAALAVLAKASANPEHAWSLLASIEPAEALAYTPVEYCELALAGSAVAPAELCESVLELDSLSVPEWLDVAEAFWGRGEYEMVQRILAHARTVTPLDERGAREFDRLAAWAVRGQDSTKPVPPGEPGVINIGVIGYGNPRRSEESTNLGDPVQTVAALGHLARFSGVRYQGPDDCVAALHTLTSRVRTEYRLPGADADVNLVPIDRDASHFCAVPPQTWLIAFGWHMQSQPLDQYDFPYDPNVIPFFVSFHVNRRAMLSQEAVEYLRENGPVGCRDWYTYDLLTHLGVEAFFSGCLTTTLDTYFDPANPREKPGVTGYVDAPAPPGETAIRQASDDVRWRSFDGNIDEALALLDLYNQRFSRVVTRRLHAYLPARTLGAVVDFTPGDPGDRRFEGLAPASDAELQEIRSGIRSLLEPVMRGILAGDSPADVRRAWEDAAAPLVERDRARRSPLEPIPGVPGDVRAAVEKVHARRVETPAAAPRRGGAIDVCFGMDRNYLGQLRTVVTALVSRTSRPLHLWIACRGLAQEDFADISRLFPEVSVTWLPCDDVDYGDVTRMIRHISVATMDRLLLPELLPQRDKVLYLDLDLLPQADIAPLFDTDLRDAPLAARPSILDSLAKGLDVVDLVAAQRALRSLPGRAWELRRRVLQDHSHDFAAFNAGVLLLNLEQMRADRFTERFIPYVRRYGMHDQDVLNVYAGGRYLPLDRRWNHIAHQERIDDPAIIHWAGPVKPWASEVVPLQDRWRAAVAVSR